MTEDILQKVCRHALTLSALAQNSPESQLIPCTFTDYKAAIQATNTSFDLEKLFRVLEIPAFVSMQTLSLNQRNHLQELLGNNWANGDYAVVAILPCDMNGVAFTQEQITNGAHIAILRVNPETHKTVYGDGLPALIPEPLWSAGLFQVELELEDNISNRATITSVEKFLQQVISHFKQVSSQLR